jgi:hypothetical protein
MSDVGVDEMSHVKQFPQLLAGRGHLDTVYCIGGLTRGQMVRAWSDATDTRNDTRNFLNRPTLAESFKPPQFRDLKVGVLHLAIVV